MLQQQIVNNSKLDVTDSQQHVVADNYLDATLNARDDRWNADVTMGLKKPKSTASLSARKN